MLASKCGFGTDSVQIKCQMLRSADPTSVAAALLIAEHCEGTVPDVGDDPVDHVLLLHSPHHIGHLQLVVQPLLHLHLFMLKASTTNEVKPDLLLFVSRFLKYTKIISQFCQKILIVF